MKLPRIQFSLRTLLVVVTLLAVGCGYAAHERHVVHQRVEMLQWLKEREPRLVSFALLLNYENGWPLVIDNSRLSWFRRLLGDHFLEKASYPDTASPDEVNPVKVAFPEAEVTPYEADRRVILTYPPQATH